MYILLYILYLLLYGHCWYGHVLRRVDGHVMRRALDFEVEGQRKKGGLMRRTWKKQVEEESVKVGLYREDAFYYHHYHFYCCVLQPHYYHMRRRVCVVWFPYSRS